jgi:hypothetical protein
VLKKLGGEGLKIFKFLVLSILLFASVGSASASTFPTVPEQVIYESKEIKDLEKLRERALKGDTDENNVHFKNNVVLKKETGKGLVKEEKNSSVKMYETTQKLKRVKKRDGTIHESMATTVFVDIPKEAINEEDHDESKLLGFIKPISQLVDDIFGATKVQAAGSQTNSKTNASYTVRSYSTIYWERKTSGGLNYIRLTRVSGGWTLLDSNFTLSNRKVVYGQTPLTKVDDTKYPTGNTFNYYTPSTWGWENDGSSVTIGATTYVTMKRGTSSSTQTFTNNYY